MTQWGVKMTQWGVKRRLRRPRGVKISRHP